MLVELGHFSAMLALMLSFLQCFLPWCSPWRHHQDTAVLVRRSVPAIFFLLLLSFLSLISAFVQNDFTLRYVAQQSHVDLPLFYRIASTWAGHEGSLLLWVLMLSLWSFSLIRLDQQLPSALMARVWGVMGGVLCVFLAFTLLTSNPFIRLLPDFSPNGRDLNPLLQDPGLIVHPPLLYAGYSGFAVPFAVAIAAMYVRRLDAVWVQLLRPWIVLPWAFLTVGIVLGSWWAYAELGWGGWWFWDPVENASVMPWLAGTALLHVWMAVEKRGVFKRWALLLSLMVFALSLLGTFLVRSGVLTSVHAFAADPDRGVFILLILVVTIGAGLALFAWRAGDIKRVANYTIVSRESLLLLNNMVLMTLLSVVIIGTLFPLFASSLGWGEFSVGPPYFNTMFLPLVILLLLVMSIGLQVFWRQHPLKPVLRRVGLGLISAIFCMVLLWGLGIRWPLAESILLGLAITAFLTLCAELWRRLNTKTQPFYVRITAIPRRYWGMQLAHIGFLMMVVAIVISAATSREHDVKMALGEHVTVGDYRFSFRHFDVVNGPNYQADRATVRVEHLGQYLTDLLPERRLYHAQNSVLTEAAIDVGWWRDIYIVLGEPVAKTQAYAFRLQIKPGIRWIWMGALLMALGGILSVSDRRRLIRNDEDAE